MQGPYPAYQSEARQPKDSSNLLAISPRSGLQIHITHLQTITANGLAQRLHRKLEHVTLSVDSDLNATLKAIHHSAVNHPMIEFVQVELSEIGQNLTDEKHG